MSQNSGWVKLHRSFTEWEWYSNLNTRSLFLHLILVANHENKNWHGVTIKRGQHVTSYPKLAKEVGLTVRSVRVALQHLKMTGEVTGESTNTYSVLTIQNYDKYQTSDTPDDRQATGKRQASDNKQELKELKNEKKVVTNVTSATHREEVDYILKCFLEAFGSTPTDKQPRNVAWNYYRNILAYKKGGGSNEDERALVRRTMSYYRTKFPDVTTTSLDTVRRHAKSAMETKLLKIKSS